MYSKEEWDDIYKKHMDDAPWMSEICAEGHIAFLEQYLPDVKGKRLLDYGCGNGLIAYHFYKKGAIVELADISDSLVDWLKDKYRKEGFKIFQCATPQDIDDNNRLYDIIIANSVFHHVQPELWTTFLKGFANILKPDGLLLLSGWDASDDIAKVRIAPYTKKTTWPITNIGLNIEHTGRFNIIAEKVHAVGLPGYFEKSKMFKYYVLKKK